MDKQRAETDKICMNAASIFRAMDALKQQQRELDAKLAGYVSKEAAKSIREREDD